MNMDTYSIRIEKHSDISQNTIDEIIKLKMQYWDYATTEQLEWISKNIRNNDLHLMVFNNDILLAYLNMVNINLKYDNLDCEILGIGNVCVHREYKGMGMGLLLMNLCNFSLCKWNKEAVLLCKDSLVPFYQKCGWKQYKGLFFINNQLFSDNIFFSNSKFINSNRIEIDRSF